MSVISSLARTALRMLSMKCHQTSVLFPLRQVYSSTVTDHLMGCEPTCMSMVMTYPVLILR